MKTIDEVMTALEKAGDPLRIRTFAKHGAPPDRMFGVTVAAMKVIAKQIKGQQLLPGTRDFAGDFVGPLTSLGGPRAPARVDLRKQA